MTAAPISLQDLQRRLYVKAKAEKDWRFWGLYVHVAKLKTLRTAFAIAKANDGAPGIDGVTFGPNTIRPAQEATRTIPIVMIAGSGDPVGDGLVANLAHPGGNVTGTTWGAGAEMQGKNLATLKEIVPGVSRWRFSLTDLVAPAGVVCSRMRPGDWASG